MTTRQPRATAQRTVLVTGGIRSGKSTYAERLLANEAATYIATGPTRDDDAWAERVRLHRERRPASWRTVETADLAAALGRIDTPCLVDDLGSWLTSALERSGAWTMDGSPAAPDWRQQFAVEADRLLVAIDAFPHHLVLVTNEVGFGLVSPYDSGRIFQDELGRLNQRVATLADDVTLVVSGCPLAIKGQVE